MSPAVTALKIAAAECTRCEAGWRHAYEMARMYRHALVRANREGIYLIAWDAMNRQERWLRVSRAWEKKMVQADALRRAAYADVFTTRHL